MRQEATESVTQFYTKLRVSLACEPGTTVGSKAFNDILLCFFQRNIKPDIQSRLRPLAIRDVDDAFGRARLIEEALVNNFTAEPANLFLDETLNTEESQSQNYLEFDAHTLIPNQLNKNRRHLNRKCKHVKRCNKRIKGDCFHFQINGHSFRDCWYATEGDRSRISHGLN